MQSFISVLYEFYVAHNLVHHISLYLETLPSPHYLYSMFYCLHILWPYQLFHSLSTFLIWQGSQLELSNNFGPNNLVLRCICTTLITCRFQLCLYLSFFSSATMAKRFYCPLGKYTLPLHSANFKAGIFNLCCITHFFLLNVFKIFLSIFLFLYGFFTDVCAPLVCLGTPEARRRYWVLWNWSFR